MGKKIQLTPYIVLVVLFLPKHTTIQIIGSKKCKLPQISHMINSKSTKKYINHRSETTRFKIAYIFELKQSQFSEICNGEMRRFDRCYELHEAHLLRSEMIHWRQPIEDLHLSSKRERHGKKSFQISIPPPHHIWNETSTFAL